MISLSDKFVLQHVNVWTPTTGIVQTRNVSYANQPLRATIQTSNIIHKMLIQGATIGRCVGMLTPIYGGYPVSQIGSLHGCTEMMICTKYIPVQTTLCCKIGECTDQATQEGSGHDRWRDPCWRACPDAPSCQNHHVSTWVGLEIDQGPQVV